MSEIKVDYLELKIAIDLLKSIEKGTGYSIYSTSEFINHSKGKMFLSINSFNKKLMEIETVLIDIVKKTNSSLISAGVEFETFESKVSSQINQNIR